MLIYCIVCSRLFTMLLSSTICLVDVLGCFVQIIYQLVPPVSIHHLCFSMHTKAVLYQNIRISSDFAIIYRAFLFDQRLCHVRINSFSDRLNHSLRISHSPTEYRYVHFPQIEFICRLANVLAVVTDTFGITLVRNIQVSESLLPHSIAPCIG
jgi:hypothetical protein